MLYASLVLAHLLAVVMFFGNILAAFLLHTCARRTREPAVLAQLYGAVSLGERWITPLSVVLMMSSGVGLAVLRELSITKTGWIIWSLNALGVSGVVLLLRLLPLQHRLEASASKAADDGNFDLESYRRDEQAWLRWAGMATTAALAAVVLMVLKPAGVPGF